MRNGAICGVDAVFHMSSNQLDQSELMFFLTGGVGLDNTRKNPDESWISQKMWDELCRMGDLPSYQEVKFLEVRLSLVLLLSKILIMGARVSKGEAHALTCGHVAFDLACLFGHRNSRPTRASGSTFTIAKHPTTRSFQTPGRDR